MRERVFYEGCCAPVMNQIINWRKNWVDFEDEIEAQSGCKCEVCELIRAIDEYLAEEE